MNKIIVRMLDLVNVNEMKKLTKDNDIMSLWILFPTVSKATTIRNISNVIISAQEDGQHLLLVFSITLLL